MVAGAAEAADVAAHDRPAALDVPEVRPRAESGLHHAAVPPAWWTWGGAQGGLVMALCARAARASAPALVLRSVSTAFLAPTGEGAVHLVSREERVTKNSAVVTTRVEQDHKVTALTTSGWVRQMDAAEVQHTIARPAVPPPETCAPYRDAELLFPFPTQVDIRPVDDRLPLSGSDVPELTAWVRLRSGARVDAAVALVMLDALAPAAYAVWTVPAVMPTLEMTAHLLADLDAEPVSGWVLVRQRHAYTGAGVSIDECDVWSSGGRHIAQARQLRRVLP